MAAKNKPIPTRFDDPEDEALRNLHEHTGLSKSELVRRAMKLLAAEVQRRGEAGWIVTEFGKPLTIRRPGDPKRGRPKGG